MDYKLVHYAVTGWEIQKKSIAEKGPNKGEEIWTHYKYPSSLKLAADALLQCVVEQKEYETVQELIEEIKRAKKEILDNLKQIVQEK